MCNCYGNKPKIRKEEDELMQISKPYPETVKDIEFQKRIDHQNTKIKLTKF